MAHYNPVDRFAKRHNPARTLLALSFFPPPRLHYPYRSKTGDLYTSDTRYFRAPRFPGKMPSQLYTRVPQCRTTSTHIRLPDRLSRDQRSPPVSANFCQEQVSSSFSSTHHSHGGTAHTPMSTDTHLVLVSPLLVAKPARPVPPALPFIIIGGYSTQS